MAKDWFNENGVKYEEFDVVSNLDKRQEMVDKSGQMGVPVIIVDDKVVVGFDQPLLEEFLQLKK